MSSPLAVKRRKLNDSSKALKKPFVSPLRTSKSNPTALKEQQNAAPYTPYRPSMLVHNTAAASTTASVTSPKGPTAKKSTTFHKPLASLRSKDPAEAAAQKAVTARELCIRTLRNEIDTLSQAARLRASSKDSELEELALKWRAAAQSAAEEVFSTVEDRVRAMGGVRAWRESEKRKWGWMRDTGELAKPAAKEGNDEVSEVGSQGDELPEERPSQLLNAEDDVSICLRIYKS
jgi:Swi5-dependent recombination DNA repair protein 1